jgi:hypothetical protein
VIPYRRGAAVAVNGGTSQWNSQHNRVHRGLERFWNGARKRYDATGVPPTNAEYGQALYRAYRKAGFDARSAYELADSARRQRISHGHLDHLPVPNIPNPFPNKRFLPGGDL